jgi:hypothetical protein
MSSLSRILKEKKKKRKTTISLPPDEVKTDHDLQKPEALVSKAFEKQPLHINYDYDSSDTEDAENDEGFEAPLEEKFKHILFISDNKLSDNIRQQLSIYSNIREFDKNLFANRSPRVLWEEHKVSHIWLCLRSVNARKWLAEYIRSPKPFSTVATFAIKQSKWISDIKKHCDVTCKFSDLKDLKSLCFREFTEKLDNVNLDIHKPANALFACLGLSNKITRTKKKE